MKMLRTGFFGVAFISAGAGLTLSAALPDLGFPRWVNALSSLFFLLIILLLYRWLNRELDRVEKQRADMLRGAAGELAVGLTLERFPDEFYVINDLTTPFGNLDHVVVGPTGVFVIDTKNWRGVVSAAGHGELLLNGEPTDKPWVRQFVGRMMGIRDKVKTLASQFDPYYQALFVFTSARVEAKWGTTSSVNCLTDDKLFDYIVEKNFGKRLPREEVEQIAQAFLGLAHMDADFTQRAFAKPSAKSLQSNPTRDSAGGRNFPVH